MRYFRENLIKSQRFMHVHPFTVGVENVISIIGTWLDCGWNAAGGGYAKVTMPCL